MSFADIEYQGKKRKTRRELFLEQINSLIPWSRLVKKLKRHYHKGRVGRRPYPLEITAASTYALEVSRKLLHGDERRIFGYAGCRGIEKRAKHSERSVDW